MARSRGQKRRKDEGYVPKVYRDLLAEVEAGSSATASHTSDDSRARKRRRVANRRPEEEPVDTTTQQKPLPCPSPVIESESSAESDVGWEDVELGAHQDLEEELDTDGLDIVLDETEAKKARGNRPRNAVPNAAQRHLRAASSRVGVSPSTASPATSDQTTSSFRPDPDGPQPLVPKVARRLGQPSFGTGPSGMDPGRAPVDAAPRRKFIKESQYPVYWVEAFDAALQKWIPVDPLVTKTVGKPLKMEPPASDMENFMSYVVAFEADGVARDVTRRYTKAFTAKTRKSRVECTAAGAGWWKGTMRFFDRGYVLHRDQVENAEFAALEAQEPMPRNVQDFKDHPLYVLERHLRRNQVIHPKNEVGKVAVGKSSASSTTKTSPTSKALEPLYRRRDVHVVRPANGWYRLGRDVKAGEQPLKWSLPTRRSNKDRSSGPNRTLGSDASDQDERTEKGLYAEFQTTPYEAPPIVNGRVPKNTYGNLDVFVPSMIPKGDQEANMAARILGIDFADAVTGFEFRGRTGTPVIKGIVTASEYAAAIEAVIQGLREQEAEAEALESSIDCLRMWRRFLVALRIHKRVGKYYDDDHVGNGGGGDDSAVEGNEHDHDHPDGRGVRGGLMQDLRMIGEATDHDVQDEGDDGGGEGEGGGFLIEDAQAGGAAEPTARQFLYGGSTSGYRDAATLEDEHAAGGGGFLISDVDNDNGDSNDATPAHNHSPPAPARASTAILSPLSACSPHPPAAQDLPVHSSSAVPSRSPYHATTNDPCDPISEKTTMFAPSSAPTSASPHKSPLASPSASAFPPASASLSASASVSRSRSPRRHHENLQSTAQSPGRLPEEAKALNDNDDDSDVGNAREEEEGEEKEEEKREKKDQETKEEKAEVKKEEREEEKAEGKEEEEEKKEKDDDEISLISHDPDDDDADPDWLVSD
ncbi:MAG: hypothetical protein M1815_000975 [Lichina confinis]|nr:MAG: hypothetical protein M1815_000975 [Lichina confinis]